MNSRLTRSLFALTAALGIWAAAGAAVEAEQAGPPGPPPKSAPAKPAEVKAAPAKAPEAKAADAKEENLAPVLSPDQFVGPAAMGYAAAKSCPHVCSKVFCYCGCDMSDNHKCLLDCFTGMHGVDCHICQEEAMLALRMSKNDDPLGTIQKTIDEAYSSKYPFREESPALKHYKAIRKWQPTVGAHAGAGQGDDGATCCGGK